MHRAYEDRHSESESSAFTIYVDGWPPTRSGAWFLVLAGLDFGTWLSVTAELVRLESEAP